MSDELPDLHLAKRGAVVLVTCIAQTMSESDPTFEDRFLQKLKVAYTELRDGHELGDMHALEMISWTRSLLTGFDLTHGQRKPFLED